MTKKSSASGSRIVTFTRLRQIVSRTPAALLPKKQKSKKPVYLILRKYININLELMSLLDKTPTTKIEKWLNRIILLGLLAWETIQKVIEIIKNAG